MIRISLWRSITAAVALICAIPAWAQAPAGSTGQCKDGSYTSAESKRGACAGHGGVKEWFATEKNANNAKSSDGAKASTSTRTTPEPAQGTTRSAAQSSSSAASVARSGTTDAAQPAAGGGAGKVWVNTRSHVYHCMGDRYYGNTKSGEYMSEAEAKAQGSHAAHGKSCEHVG